MPVPTFREIPSTENINDTLTRDVLNSLRENQQILTGIRGDVNNRALLVVDLNMLGILGVRGSGKTANLFRKDQSGPAPFEPGISGRLTDAGGGSSLIVAVTRIINTDSPYTVLATDQVIFADTDAGVITVNLPAGTPGVWYKIINCGSSDNNVTVAPNGSETI